ncbi:MAG TPA: amidohydrolase family protein [Blastocatellia bacterium]|nr:amidohydrolase family protein [Blastocatellia bacterium]HNG34564.1 amidohydrolase family protein [Blastocatellia bacterium]
MPLFFPQTLLFKVTKASCALLAGLAVWLALPATIADAQRAADFDIVLANGRVMDPESGLDAVRHVGIRNGKIAAVSAAPLKGKTLIDAKGLVVTAGFIDLHSHGQDDENYRYKARDGVTTALEMEVGASPVAKWYADREGKSLINFGATVGHIPARMAVMKDTGAWLPRDLAITRRATADENRQIHDLIKQGLDDGALGIGFGIAYVPATRRDEIFEIFKLAAERKVTCFVHARSHGAVEPGSAMESFQEVIADAIGTGASLHIVHLTSTGLRQTPVCLEMIEGARKRGVDVTMEAYPYTAAMTGLETAIFDDGWQEKMGISYGDLQWVATGERLNAESFARYRKQGGLAVIHSIPEEIARLAVANPQVMIASDGVITNGKGHPRGAGSYARVLGRYVREQKVIPLMDALRKMSLLPAQRLEKSVPAMRAKGRVKIGADADLIVFDPATVIDRATFENPAQYSTGITQVLVGGVFVVRDEKLVEAVSPGRGIRRK